MLGPSGKMRIERIHISAGLWGHSFNMAPSQAQNWAVTELLPSKTGICRGVSSRRTGLALGGMVVPRAMRLFGVISNEEGINPLTSSNFNWTFVLSLVCSSTTFSSPIPSLADGLGGEQPQPLCWKHQAGSSEAAAPVGMKDLGLVWYQVNVAQPN